MVSTYLSIQSSGKRFLGVVGYIVAVYGGSVIFSVAVLALLSISTEFTQASMEFTIASLILQSVGFGIITGMYFRYRNNWSWDLLQFKKFGLREVIVVCGGVSILFSVLFVVSAVLNSFGVQTAENTISSAGSHNPTLLLLLIPLSILFIGPSEELVFRGVIQGKLKQIFNTPTAILLASLLFGVIHYMALVGSSSGKVTYIFVAALLGLILGVTYEYTQSLFVPVLIHGIYNALLFLTQYFSITGMFPS